MTIRERMERMEHEMLSPYAALSENSKGRDYPEAPCDIRPVYQRDRDRILHCKAFRRLKNKTQVFLTPKGDHYRTRMSHTLEVSQNARTIAKALRLNEDLVEAIALGHDLGHTPFGHVGEKTLTSTMPHTLEGKIVRFSDKIAYIHHDIDDAVRGKIMVEEDIPIEIRKVLGKNSADRLDTLIHDIITNSMDKPDIIMSDEIFQAMQDLRKFMFVSVYTNPIAKGEETKAEGLLSKLFTYYMEHPMTMPAQYTDMIAEGEEEERVVCDYIAGMTDQYAIAKFSEYFVPKAWQVN